MTDPISDMIIRIQNAGAARKESLVMPYSKIKESILNVLQKSGYLKSVDKQGKGVKKELKVDLLYVNGKTRIGGFQRVSKYSQRKYSGSKDLYSVKNGRGMYVLTTPNGVLTDKEAKTQNVGGEVILKIW